MIQQANGEAYAQQVDLTKREDVYRMANRVKKEIGNVRKDEKQHKWFTFLIIWIFFIQVDILVNNAGILNGKQMLDCTDEQIQLTFDVNTLAPFWVLNYLFNAPFKINSNIFF